MAGLPLNPLQAENDDLVTSLTQYSPICCRSHIGPESDHLAEWQLQEWLRQHPAPQELGFMRYLESE